MIVDRISCYIPLQIKILNMVIPILKRFCSLLTNWALKDASRRIYCCKFFKLSNLMSHYKSKCIRTGAVWSRFIMFASMIKCSWPYILLYTSPNKNFEYGYPHSKEILQSPHKLSIERRQSQDILLQIFEIIQSDVALQKQVHKNRSSLIKIHNVCFHDKM